MANKFEELLASIVPEEGDRKAILAVATKYPELQEGYLRQADYSRNMDGLRKEKEEVDGRNKEFETFRSYHNQHSKWYADNWVSNAYGEGLGATKRELEKDKSIQELQGQVQVGGEVTFDDLNKYLDSEAEKRGWVSQDSVAKTLAEKESGVKSYVDNYLGNVSHMVTKAPQLAVRHFKQFGEELDVEGLVKFAVDSKYSNLEDAYKKQTEGRVQEIEKAQREKELQTAKETGAAEERKKHLDGQMTQENLPVDSGSPDMTHFQKFVLGVKPKEGEGNGRVVPDEVPFGRGAVAAYAARVGDRRAAENNAA